MVATLLLGHEGQLEQLMGEDAHIQSVVNCIDDYASDRKRIIIFCVTIAHAEAVSNALKKNGFRAMFLHSKMPEKQREMVLSEFEKGNIRILVNVMVLSEGFDSPAIDCVVMARPTLSPVVHVQALGRGLRPHPDKENVLFLDLVGNFTRLGDPNSPLVTWSKGNGSGEAPMKVCPACSEFVFSGCRVCPECEHKFELPKVDKDLHYEMQDVSFEPEPYEMIIDDCEIGPYVSKKGNEMLKVAMQIRLEGSLKVESRFVPPVEDGVLKKCFQERKRVETRKIWQP